MSKLFCTVYYVFCNFIYFIYIFNSITVGIWSCGAANIGSGIKKGYDTGPSLYDQKKSFVIFTQTNLKLFDSDDFKWIVSPKSPNVFCSLFTIWIDTKTCEFSETLQRVFFKYLSWKRNCFQLLLFNYRQLMLSSCLLL